MRPISRKRFITSSRGRRFWMSAQNRIQRALPALQPSTEETAVVGRILLVEDDEALCVLLRYNLQAEGFAVETISRGDEAELSLREGLPDLLILDWMLPGLSGI